MEKILTISVAAYNVERFIEYTLQSLANSKYVEKLEVFVVDDGGTDGTLEIARRFESQYPYTFRAVHKENGGYGSTVNYSISHATGKYFKLLDGDDWMDTNGLDRILEKLEQIEDDVVITDYYTGPDESNLSVISNRHEDNVTVYIKEYGTDYPHGMWSIFYKTTILKQSRLHLPKHMLYTDQIYSTVPFAFADTIRFYQIPVYCYRFGREDQSTSKSSRIKHYKEMLSVCAMLYSFYEKHKTNNKYLKSRVSRYYLVALKTLMLFPADQDGKRRFMQYESKMKEQYADLYYHAVGSTKAGKFVKLLRLSNYHCYWMIKYFPETILL